MYERFRPSVMFYSQSVYFSEHAEHKSCYIYIVFKKKKTSTCLFFSVESNMVSDNDIFRGVVSKLDMSVSTLKSFNDLKLNPSRLSSVRSQLEGSAQYVIETRDAVQMRAWLSDIRNGICLR